MSVSRSYFVDTLAAEDVVVVESTTVAARAMFAPDVPVARRTRSGLPRRGRPALAELVLRDGPPVLCVLVGTPEGRWHEEFTFRRGSGGEVARMLSAANGVCDQAQVVVDAPVTFGLAVMLSWRFVHGTAGYEETYVMMQAAQGAHRRRGDAKFLEHPVLASMPLPLDTFPTLPQEWSFMPANALGRRLLEELGAVTHGRSVDVVRQWEATYGPLAEEVLAWPAWHPLAKALSIGSWPADVTVRFKRSDTGRASEAPVMPSARLLRYFVALPCSELLPPAGSVRTAEVRCHGSQVPAIPVQRVLQAVRFASALKSQASAGAAFDAAREMLTEDDTVTIRHRGVTLPSRPVLQRARVRFDVATMLWRRSHWSRESQRTVKFRYLSYDASPQGGVEVFATVERIVTLSGSGATPEVEERRLPLVTLGHGRVALADKLHAHVHQTWLEYGPEPQTLQRANSVVRQCLSDMGTEFGLADCCDVTHECLRSGSLGAAGAWLYPLALQVPGTQHILDTIIKDGLDRISWWLAWQVLAKGVCQWVHPRPRREYLQARLAGQSELVQSLDAGVDTFADWRWQTLAVVTASLLRIQDALVRATAGLADGDLASRDGVVAQTFLLVVRSPLFWKQCHALHDLVKPITMFSSWLRGCPCHEADLMGGKVVVCSWKGCRALELAQRVLAFAADLVVLRDADTGMEDVSTHDAVTRVLCVAQLKFAWVHELPYLIWQVHSPRTAAHFLATYDAAQTPQHRVSTRFGAGDLRPDMERWAAGGRVSEALLLEVQAYQWCKLDDTWAESTHRDVSRDRARVTNASQAWQSSTLRLGQNLALWDKLDPHGRVRFDIMFRRWKAIGQIVPRRALVLRQRKLSMKGVLQFVYRTAGHALEDWAGQLQHALQPATRGDLLPQLTFSTCLQVDFLERVIKPGQLFSFPIVDDVAVLTCLETSALVSADAQLHEAGMAVQFMQLVEGRLRRRKLPCTESARLRRGMWCPVSVQLFSAETPMQPVWSPDGDVQTTTVRPQGTPVVRDIVHLAPWRVWRGGLRLWAHAPGTLPGTMRAGAPERVSLRLWNITAEDTPAVVVLERLVEDGWRVGTPPVAHTPSSPRTFRKPNSMALKAYWQCLVILDELFACGLPQLLSAMPQQHYVKVLQAHRAGGMLALEMSSRSVVEASSSAVSPSGMRNAEDCQAQCDDMPMDRRAVAKALVPTTQARLVEPRPSTKRARTTQDFRHDAAGSVLWCSAPAAIEADLGAPAELQVPSTSPAPVAPSTAPIVPSAVATPLETPDTRGRASSAVVDLVEGVAVRVEERGVEGTAGYYRRLCVTCPWHSNVGGAQCRARRNTGARQTAMLGVHEPLAFLGAWLAAGPACASREEHVALRPTSADTQAYAQEHGLV